MRKAIDLGRKRLGKEFDVVNIIQESRQLRTLLSMLLEPDEQKMIRFQRHQAVIELDAMGDEKDEGRALNEQDLLMEAVQSKHDSVAISDQSLSRLDKLRNGILCRS